MAVLRSDDFNRPDSASLGTPSDGGSAWTSAGNCAIESNMAVGAVFGSNPLASRLEASAADVIVKLTMVQGWTGGIGPAVRVSGTQDFIQVYCADSNIVGPTAPKIVKWVAGVQTDLHTCSGSTASGDTVWLEANGNTLTAYVNGVSVGSVSDSFNASVTKHGFAMSTGQSSREKIDAFSIDSVGGGGGTKTGAIYHMMLSGGGFLA